MVGKSSAMAWGGRYLYRLLVRERGMDPRRILVTDLDADYRVHPQYFSYLTWMHLTDPNRETQLYQPIPYLHNNIWEAPLLAAALRRGADPAADVAQRAAGEAAELRLVLDDAASGPRCRLLGDRCHPRGQPLLLEELLHLRRQVPGRAPVHPDLRRRGPRAKTYWRTMAEQYLQARRWAWGVTDIPFVIQNAIAPQRDPDLVADLAHPQPVR